MLQNLAEICCIYYVAESQKARVHEVVLLFFYCFKGESNPFIKQKNKNICDLAEDVMRGRLLYRNHIDKENFFDMMKTEKGIGIWKNK